MNRYPIAIFLALIACGIVASCGDGGGERLKGDADGDGKLTEADAAVARKMANGILPMLDHMDVTEDGEVTEADAEWILAHLGPAAEGPAQTGEGGEVTSGGDGGATAGGDGGTAADEDAGSEAEDAGQTVTNAKGETVYRAYVPPTGGRVFKGLWSACPPAWTSDSKAIVMPGWNEFQVYELNVSSGNSTPLIKSLPPVLAQLKSAGRDHGMFLSRVIGSFAHVNASSYEGKPRLNEEVRVPLAGGAAEVLGPPKPDAFRQGLPKDWDVAGISPDRTLVAVTGKGYNPLDGNQRNPTLIYRMPNTNLGDLTGIKEGSSRSVAFSPDGNLIACVVNYAKMHTKRPHRLYLVQMSNLKAKQKLLEFSGWAGGNLSFSPDSRLLAIQVEWDRPQKRRLPWQKIYVIPVP